MLISIKRIKKEKDVLAQRRKDAKENRRNAKWYISNREKESVETLLKRGQPKV